MSCVEMCLAFLRSRKFQARNPFAPIADPPFTRAQYGVTLGGPLAKDRTFFFFAFERHQRNESGFFTSDVANGLNSSVTIGAPFLPFSQTFTNITSAQAGFCNQRSYNGDAAFDKCQSCCQSARPAIG